jgi:hypothetical protein
MSACCCIFFICIVIYFVMCFQLLSDLLELHNTIIKKKVNLEYCNLPTINQYNILNEEIGLIDPFIKFPSYQFSIGYHKNCKKFICSYDSVHVICTDYITNSKKLSIKLEKSTIPLGINKEGRWIIYENSMDYESLKEVINCISEEFKK